MTAVFSKSKLAAAANLKSTLPVEPPSLEMNSLFVIFNQLCNFYWGILTLKGSLLLGVLMLKRFFARNSAKSARLLRVKIWRFFGPETPHSEFECTKPQKARVSIGTRLLNYWACNSDQKLRPVGWPRKRKKAGRRVTKPLYLATNWRRHFTTDRHQIWWVCRSYRRNPVCQVFFPKYSLVFPDREVENAFSL